MQIIQQLHRKGLRRLFILSVLTPLVFGIALADPAATATAQTTPASTSATTTASTQAANTDKTAAKSTTTAAPASDKAAAVNTAATQPAVTQLPTIVVTAATRKTQPVDTTATTTTVITHDDLDNSKYASVPDALQSVPGLSVITPGMPGGSGGPTAVFIHGMEARQTLVTVDGRREAVGLDGLDDNLTNLTLDNVDQIEVVRTPISSSQGGSAMGGVINIVTLSGKGLSTPEGSVSEEIGSFNTFRENAESRGAVDNFDYALSATRQDSIYPALSPGEPSIGVPGFANQADQYRNTAYRGNFGYQVTPDIYIDLHSSYNNGYTSAPGEYTSPDPTANSLLEDWVLSPEIVAKVADFYTTNLYYTRNQQRQVYDDPYGFNNEGGGQGWITHTQINTDSIDWQNDFEIAHNWSLTAGLQGDNRNFYVYDDGVGYRTVDGNDNNIGGYLSSQYSPVLGLNILSSVRYDAYSQFGNAFTWRQAAAYTIDLTQTVVHASVSRAFTPPTLQDTVYSFPPYYYPNPDLVPETDLGWEAGVEQPFLDNRIVPSATYFYNDLHNSIQSVPIPGTFASTEANVYRATTDGVELGVTVKPWSTVTANVNYTYLNAVNDTAQTRLIRRPRNSLNFTGTWKPLPPLTLTMGGSWVVGRQDDVFDPLPPYTSAQTDVPDYFVLRATANYQINKNVSIWLRGENLTDRNYQPTQGYYAPSIAGYGGIKVSF